MLPVPALEPRDEPADELGEACGLLVDEAVLLLVREIEGRDALAHRSVEELEPGADQALDRAAVQPGEARKVVLVRQIEPGHHERQHLRVLRTDAVVGARREAELAAQTPQELGRAPELGGKALVARRHPDGLGQEQAERKRELSRGHAPDDVLERDPGLLERPHEPDEVHVGRREEPVLARLQEAELLQPPDVLERARNELGQLRRRHLGHGVTLTSPDERAGSDAFTARPRAAAAASSERLRRSCSAPRALRGARGDPAAPAACGP